MFPRLKHYSVTFMHVDKAGQMDGFRAYDIYAFSEDNATIRCTKKFVKEYQKSYGKTYFPFLPAWHIDCEVI